MKQNSIRIVGLLMAIFSMIGIVRLGLQDIKLIGLTPEKCTGLASGTIVDVKYGSQMRYGRTSRTSYENFYDVYYDVIDYKVDGKTYEITSRHGHTGDPIIGAQTDVHYNPTDPAKAYDNSPPYFNGAEYYYYVMVVLMGVALFFRLDKYLKR